MNGAEGNHLSQVRLSYSALDTSDLRAYSDVHRSDPRAASLAEVLVLVNATFQIVDGERVVFEEPSFPVIELASSLRRWVTEDDRSEFLFESMSFEEVGSVRVIRRAPGWLFGSVFEPDVWSRPVTWPEVEACVGVLVSRVREDLLRLGFAPALVFA